MTQAFLIRLAKGICILYFELCTPDDKETSFFVTLGTPPETVLVTPKESTPVTLGLCSLRWFNWPCSRLFPRYERDPGE